MKIKIETLKSTLKINKKKAQILIVNQKHIQIHIL